MISDLLLGSCSCQDIFQNSSASTVHLMLLYIFSCTSLEENNLKLCSMKQIRTVADLVTCRTELIRVVILGFFGTSVRHVLGIFIFAVTTKALSDMKDQKIREEREAQARLRMTYCRSCLKNHGFCVLAFSFFEQSICS